MTILYKCTIESSKDIRGPFEKHYIEIESEYCIPNTTLRRMAIDRLPLGFVCFGTLTVDTERK